MSMDISRTVEPRSDQLGRVRRAAMDRFLEKTMTTDSGCIVWTGGLNGVGYGQFYVGRTSRDATGKGYAHRWSYEQFVGPIPEGMHIDHLCRNRACVNPDHLDGSLRSARQEDPLSEGA
jgi:hypothetical protein